jgi:hypothetical protein
VLQEWRATKIDYCLMMITARRVGKTTAMAMFNAALLLHCPGIVISVFSTGKRASKSLKEAVEKFVGMTGDANKRRIINSNQEELFIAHKPIKDSKSSKRSDESQNLRMDPLTARMYSFPSSVTGKICIFYIFNRNEYDFIVQ